MAITLPVSGGDGATKPSTYYSGSNQGEYGFISLTEVVDNFTAAYVGEGKILGSTLRADINYHAHRALQELSYDTLVSCKSQEIEVCPNLRMPLPHDYVNYVKLTWSDSNGIEHVLYPVSKTSNPFAISQTENCEYEYSESELLEQENCVTTTITCSAFENDDWDDAIANIPSPSRSNWPYSFTIGTTLHSYNSVEEMWIGYTNAVDVHCNCLASNNSEGATNCGVYYGWDGCGFPGGKYSSKRGEGCGWEFNILKGVEAITYTTTICDNDSDTLSNYNDSLSSSNLNLLNTAATDDDIYSNNSGQRYGLNPQYSQGNGSFYMDCLRGNIHFSSNMAGQTIILKYISDGHGTSDEMIVHKFAEEAMYKWIAYGCASARVDVPEGVVQRLKKERFAETRKAKIRLSNIKIEEITQIMRGKSKWIKH